MVGGTSLGVETREKDLLFFTLRNDTVDVPPVDSPRPVLRSTTQEVSTMDPRCWYFVQTGKCPENFGGRFVGEGFSMSVILSTDVTKNGKHDDYSLRVIRLILSPLYDGRP